MFTVEIESNYSKLVSVDADNEFEDVEMYLEDNGTVFIRQFCEELNEYQLITVNYAQILELKAALDADEGVYITDIK
jgi:hypothetical protein|tara:strand:- start:111 stop:341 length:231 start_codon:yes stop_codon:yes gene_type:complete